MLFSPKPAAATAEKRREVLSDYAPPQGTKEHKYDLHVKRIVYT